MRTARRIRRIRNATIHYLMAENVTSLARFVQIEERDGMYYVLRLDDSGKCIADTAHASQSEAVAQVEFEYELEAAEDKLT